MAVLDVIVAPALSPDVLIGLQSHLLDAVVTRQTPPVALIYSSVGRYISIGRYHLYAGPAERGGIGAYRRLTGGRVVGSGEGWLGLALILPSRIALLKEDASRLKPEQIMNRYARGLLAGLRALGLDCFYPGRDAITFERRELAMCSFETDRSGAMLFESMLAVNRGMENLVHDLELIDPDGALPCRMYDSESATTLARELKREIAFDELADAIAAGYEGLLGETRRRELTAIEMADASRRALVASGWLNDRIALRSGTIKKNRIAAQLGAIEAAVTLAADGTIAAVTLSGDFIANSSAIAELENELIGKRLDLGSVSHAVTKIFGHSENFFLGAGELSNLVRLIAGVN
ncbi:MAG TPA: lipoate protein ligase C-terminal domain-containing protein [Methylomirabilota bacterium]|nr:lipoate protein ligase C-terminal domain-containing protein [Methylomirabilota bacterium]